jgi:hypothetical protein
MGSFIVEFAPGAGVSVLAVEFGAGFAWDAFCALPGGDFLGHYPWHGCFRWHWGWVGSGFCQWWHA